jgi:pimeloyl-ACP methyl ester carboxylesterase
VDERTLLRYVLGECAMDNLLQILYRTKRLSAVAVALFLSLVVTSGSESSQTPVNPVLAAPNTFFSMHKAWQGVWDAFLPRDSKSNSPLIRLTIPVGPPEAKLNVVELMPRDYHIKIISTIMTNQDGSRYLSLDWPREPHNTFAPLAEPATIVILHGYTLFKETMAPWALLLAQAGYRVVLVDLRGHGESSGEKVSFGKYETADLSQLLDCLSERHLCDQKIGVLGLSYGATLALHWAARDQRVRTVVAIAPYNQLEETLGRFITEFKMPVPQTLAQRCLALGATELNLKWTDWSAENALAHLKQPVFLIGGGKDNICPPKDLDTLTKASPPGSKNLQVPPADHISVGVCFHVIGEPVKTWFNEHLVATAKPKLK